MQFLMDSTWGVGVLHLFARTEQERRININSVGPVWDGNEIWLIAGGGALFAAFTPVYAAIWSGFYLALILLLAALIARAVAFDFRAKVQSVKWKRFFDYCFAAGSLLICAPV
jgi:cytochrome d ubiquinol oxidase subunit II